MSQGYSLSSDARATVVSGEPYWDSLAQFTGDRGLIADGYAPSAMTASGYYYTKDFVEPAFNRVFLDESAANTFANAKHLSVGKSGLAKMVQIYGPYTAAMGDSAINSNKQYGRGYKSSGQFDLGKAN